MSRGVSAHLPTGLETTSASSPAACHDVRREAKDKAPVLSYSRPARGAGTGSAGAPYSVGSGWRWPLQDIPFPILAPCDALAMPLIHRVSHVPGAGPVPLQLSTGCVRAGRLSLEGPFRSIPGPAPSEGLFRLGAGARPAAAGSSHRAVSVTLSPGQHSHEHILVC